jgi:hypothetical protein
MLVLPDVVALEQANEFAPIEHVGERLALLRRAQDARRIAFDLLVLVEGSGRST